MLFAGRASSCGPLSSYRPEVSKNGADVDAAFLNLQQADHLSSDVEALPYWTLTTGLQSLG